MNSNDFKRDLFVKTPLIESVALNEFCPRKVFLKLENCQPSGSFKMRGISRLCEQALLDGCHEVVCSSGGNAGLAAATSARLLGIRCRIIVPNTTSKLMRNMIEREGAMVEVYGNVWNEANEKALQIVKQSDRSLYVHPFDNPIVWAGHSTMIDEIAEQLDTIPSMIISACGGGGLLCGIIQGMRRHNWTSVPVLAMETTGANSLNASVKDIPIVPVKIPKITSVATSLGALQICQQLADDYNKSRPSICSHLVEDREAVDACLKFADQHRILVEPACGASLAALYTGLVQQLFQQNSLDYSEGPVVVIVCGGSSISLDMLNAYKIRFNL